MRNRLLSIVTVLVLGTLLLQCGRRGNRHTEPDSAFAAYVAAYTHGIISARSPIVIELQDGVNGDVPGDVVQLSPSVKGTLVLEHGRFLVFTPAEPLRSGTRYTVKVALKKITPVEKGFETFTFQVQTIAQQMDVYTDSPAAYQFDRREDVYIEGIVTTADVADEHQLALAMKATQNEKPLEMEWKREGDTRFAFTIHHAVRSDLPGNVTLTWDGAPLESQTRGSAEIAIPALGDFKVIQARAFATPQLRVELSFSDPIAEQKLEGIIFIEGVATYTHTIDGHKVNLYPEGTHSGTKLVEVGAGLRNWAGKGMESPWSGTVTIHFDKPQVRFVDNKGILPGGEAIVVPFEAVALRAVDVYVYKIFNNNILQYLQENDIGDSYAYLRRTGRHMYKKHIDLRTTGKNLQVWNRHHLDLADLIKPDPGAFYKIELRYKPEYACYTCAEGEVSGTGCDADAAALRALQSHPDGPLDAWEFYDSYFDGINYDYQHESNPCYRSYYRSYKATVGITVMTTHLGLAAKMGTDGKMLAVVTNLHTAQPVGGALVEVYDFQQQPMARGTTDAQGFATLDLKGEPFVAIASHRESKTYLKLLYNSLNMSRFEVDGASVSGGLKAFIYGERDVWRPGDSLYLTLALHDKDNKAFAAGSAPQPVALEVRNPDGQVVHTADRTRHVNGFYDFRMALPADAPTGTYSATFKLGNHKWYRSLRIETVKPNRLKVQLQCDQSSLLAAPAIQAAMEAQWLHGANAGPLKATVQMRVGIANTRFEKWKDYHFENRFTDYQPTDEKVVYDGKLDANGRASFSIDVKPLSIHAPGMLKLSFFTRVFEAGGDFSVDYQSVNYAPYKAFAGMRVPQGKLWGGALETDTDHSIDLVVIDPMGQPVNRPQVEVKLFKINSSWWYDRYDGQKFNFTNSNSYRLVQSIQTPLNSGKGSLQIRVENQDWGRYVLQVTDPVSGHSAAQFIYFDWPYWMRANRTSTEAGNILGLSSDKKDYQIGERIQLTIPSPERGRALVCVENGTRVLQKFWVSTQAGESHIELPVTSEMAPNVFVHIAMLQPHNQTANDRPLRTFGILPISVYDPGTVLEPKLTLPAKFTPETTAEIGISEAKGRAMTYTLAIVDEGLLDLTRFASPDPWKHFYAREALGVRTWDMYDDVVGSLGQQAGSLLSLGGDEVAPDPSKQKAQRFKPMVRFLGPFTLPAGKQAKHAIAIPNYVGSVRVMLIAGSGASWGHAAQAVPVTTPLMVLGTMPRVLGPGEEVSLSANVFAIEPSVKEAKVTVSTTGAFATAAPQSKSVYFDKPGDRLVSFPLKASGKAGMGKVTIEAVANGKKAFYEIEIDVRNPNPALTTFRDTVLAPGSTWKPVWQYFGMDGTNGATVELTTMPPLHLESRLGYLITYPHGCAEQTVSAAFPQLYLNKLITLSAARQADIDSHISHAIQRLRSYQQQGGALTLWPGTGEADGWVTSWAGHFMLEAEAAGHLLPPGMKAGWINGQRELARRWNIRTDRTTPWLQRVQAYRLYTLALAGRADLSSMNLLRDLPPTDPATQWLLALAYAEAGQGEAARKVLSKAPQAATPYTELAHTYGSDTRDEALLLMALHKLDMPTQAAETARRIARRMASNDAYSTQTTAMALLALSKYLGQQKAGEPLQATVDEKSYQTGSTMVQHRLSANGNRGKCTIVNHGTGQLYARLILKGEPLPGNEQGTARHLRCEVAWYDLEAKPINPAELHAGTDMVMTVKVTNPGTRGDLKQLVLTQILPPGWELTNKRLFGESENDPFYQDIRDDRVMTYFDLPKGQSVVFRFRLNATYAGRFYLPATLCTAMYDESITASEPGRWVRVLPETPGE
jgi:uncharacterized protein YfaS (alpha-2-macroglobulin family)